MKGVIGLVSCTARKLGRRAKARELYTASDWFKDAFPLAERCSDKVWILSAKYRLLDPDEDADPYVRSMKDLNAAEKTAWVEAVWAALQNDGHFAQASKVLWFAGRDYRDELVAKIQLTGKENLIPLAGQRIGEQNAWLQQNRDLGLEGILSWCQNDLRRTVKAGRPIPDQRNSRPAEVVSPAHLPNPGEYFLEETDDEFLLYIHYSEKGRASGIDGRQWDAKRKCWVYPKNRRSFHALLAEFGDELVGVKRDPSFLDAPLGPANSAVEKRDEYLVTQLAEARVQISQQEKELQLERAERGKLEGELRRLRKTVSQISESEKEKVAKIGEPRTWAQQIVDSAMTASGDSTSFRSLLAAIHLDYRFPIEVHGALTVKLRQLVGEENGGREAFDLIGEAGRRGLLSEVAVNCAHVIRMQRNFLVHTEESGPIDESSMFGRIALCLFAAAIVWREFPE